MPHAAMPVPVRRARALPRPSGQGVVGGWGLMEMVTSKQQQRRRNKTAGVDRVVVRLAVHALDRKLAVPAAQQPSAGEHTHENARRTCGRRRDTTPANRKLHTQARTCAGRC
jgi:hypothetical protein